MDKSDFHPNVVGTKEYEDLVQKLYKFYGKEVVVKSPKDKTEDNPPSIEEDSVVNDMEDVESYEYVVNHEDDIDTPSPEPSKPIESKPQQHYESPKESTGDSLVLKGSTYSFKQLELNTSVAQSYIDNNPECLGLWSNVIYSNHRMDIYFGHDYGGGEIVYNSEVGDVITMTTSDGTSKKYQVVAKTIASVNDYYTTNTPLWDAVGNDFDTMIKTCYKRDVTDLVIALKTIA